MPQGHIIVADDDSHTADAEQAIQFCRDAGNLAVFAPAIGTAHGVYKRDPSIEWDTLTKIKEATDTPLALHGGTGLSDGIIQRAIKLGCAKVNISTNLKHVFIDDFIAYHQAHPREDEGAGDREDQAIRRGRPRLKSHGRAPLRLRRRVG